MRKEVKNSLPDDREIILGVLNGSKETLNQLYKAYFPMVLHLVMTNSGDESDAKDVFQETVLVVYNKIQSGNFELSSKLKTFIYAVSRRLWLKKINHKSRKSEDIKNYEEVLQVDEDLTIHEERESQFKQMEQSLSLLGEPCKTIIEDFYIHNRSMQEICEKFGYTNADNAKTQKYKCLQRLKKLFFEA